MSIPVQCHLWQKDELTPEDLHQRGLWEHVKKYEEDSHFWRDLLRCTRCGQLYFFEFYEVIDWEHGNDPQYCTYIPVDSVEEADRIAQGTTYDILLLAPRLQKDFPSDAQRPRVYWVGRDAKPRLEAKRRPSRLARLWRAWRRRE